MTHKQLPLWFYLGIILNISGWIISWAGWLPFSIYTFGPIWFGLILAIDGLNYRLSGSSLLSRSKRSFFGLFLMSSVFWWFFELVVIVTKNWYYVTDNAELSVLLHQILGTVYFSTVIPGVLEMTELVDNLKLLPSKIKFVKFAPWTVWIFIALILVSFTMPLVLPQFFFPFIWMALYFLFDTLNYLQGRSSLLADAMANNWNRAFTLAFAGLLCGVCWELWNSYADPKWVYEVPFVGGYKVFEMPILGFLGYIPFAFEIFAVFVFAKSVLGLPLGRYFNLEDLAPTNWKYSWFALPVLISIILVTSVTLGAIEHNLTQEFFAQKLTVAKSNLKPLPLSEVSELKTGVINACVLGIQPGHCLVTDTHEYYMLLDSELNKLQTEIGKSVWIEGEVIDHNLNVGMDELVVKNIYRR